MLLKLELLDRPDLQAINAQIKIVNQHLANIHSMECSIAGKTGRPSIVLYAGGEKVDEASDMTTTLYAHVENLPAATALGDLQKIVWQVDIELARLTRLMRNCEPIQIQLGETEDCTEGKKPGCISVDEAFRKANLLSIHPASVDDESKPDTELDIPTTVRREDIIPGIDHDEELKLMIAASKNMIKL